LSYYQYDGGGSVRQLTNSVGQVTDSYEYDAFGNSFTKQGTTPNNYLYRGEQYDSDLGLYYLRARYYNPATGRFMSKDPKAGKPIDPKTLHKYLYAGGDPVNRIDPRGREALADNEEPRAVVAGENYSVWRRTAHEVAVELCIEGTLAALFSSEELAEEATEADMDFIASQIEAARARCETLLAGLN